MEEMVSEEVMPKAEPEVILTPAELVILYQTEHATLRTARLVTLLEIPAVPAHKPLVRQRLQGNHNLQREAILLIPHLVLQHEAIHLALQAEEGRQAEEATAAAAEDQAVAADADN
jgi:hypothetical protein